MKNLSMKTLHYARGFSLLEISIGMALAALGVIATLQMRAAQSQLDTARSVAQMYERYSNALGTYMTLYHDELVPKARQYPQCATLAFRGGGYTNIPSASTYSDCGIKLKSGQDIGNFLQPTLEELSMLGILPSSAVNQLPLPTYAANPQGGGNVVYGRNGIKAGDIFALLVQPICVGGTPAGQPFTSSADCSNGSLDLRSLVFNLQPYAVGEQFTEVLLAQIQEAGGGGRTYYSDAADSKKLKAHSGAPDPVIENPILNNADTNQGVPFILAMRNGYNSAGNDVFLRKDGTIPLTGNWKVGGKNIEDVGMVGATSVNANNGIFTYLFSDAFKTGYGYITALLRIERGATLQVDKEAMLQVDGKTKVGDFRLENEAALGGACSPSTQTLARASAYSTDYDNNLRLLVCDPTSSKWVRPQQDYGASIAGLTNTTTGLVNTTAGLSQKRLVAYYDVLYWQAATYGTNYPDKYQTVPNYQAAGAGRTWLPTRFSCAAGDVPPVVVSLDWVAEPGQTLVYDVGCKNDKWYFAMGPKERNIEYGNVCSSGLDSKLLNPVRDPYTAGYAYSSQGPNCIRYNLLTPNFNANSITATVMILKYE